MKVVKYFLVFLTIWIIDLEAKSFSPRIKYGQVSTEEYPFMAFIISPALYRPGKIKMCGGSVVSNNWILTAGHCVVDAATGIVTPGDSVTAYLGSNIRFAGTPFNSVQVIPHERYDTIKNDNDLALIQLEDYIPPQYTPIAIPSRVSSDGYAGETVLAMGWGLTERGSVSNQLLTANLHLQDKNRCASLQNRPRDGRICAYVKNGPNQPTTGQGDSGGPIVIKNNMNQYVQLGLVSLGVNSTLKDPLTGQIVYLIQNDVFTDVAYYSQWINQKIQQFY